MTKTRSSLFGALLLMSACGPEARSSDPVGPEPELTLHQKSTALFGGTSIAVSAVQFIRQNRNASNAQLQSELNTIIQLETQILATVQVLQQQVQGLVVFSALQNVETNYALYVTPAENMLSAYYVNPANNQNRGLILAYSASGASVLSPDVWTNYYFGSQFQFSPVAAADRWLGAVGVRLMALATFDRATFPTDYHLELCGYVRNAQSLATATKSWADSQCTLTITEIPRECDFDVKPPRCFGPLYPWEVDCSPYPGSKWPFNASVVLVAQGSSKLLSTSTTAGNAALESARSPRRDYWGYADELTLASELSALTGSCN